MTQDQTTSLDLLLETFLERLQHFVNIEDYATADALHDEFIVDGIDSLDTTYEWNFLPHYESI